VSLLILEGDLQVSLTVGVIVTSSWKILKMPGFSFVEDCEDVQVSPS
jgi:hypothetical protein